MRHSSTASHSQPYFWLIYILVPVLWIGLGHPRAFAQTASMQSTAGIGEIIAQVSGDSLMDRVRELCGEKRVQLLGMDTLITNRFDGKDSTNNELAGDYLERELLRHGLLAGSQRFQDRGRNVLGIQQGMTHPDIKFIICAHYDAATYRYPGADDNASGTAGVLEAARLLSRYSFDYTIEYILWDAEERGLVGSKEYARAARARGDSIIGVFNLDMIAWDSNGDSRTTLQYNLPIGEPLIAAMQTVNDSFALGLDMRPELTATTPSDNYSFTQFGYPAFLFIEDFKDFTPYYHKTTDLPSSLNVPFFTRMTRAAVAGLTLMAGLRAEPRVPMLIAPVNGGKGQVEPVVFAWETDEAADYYHLQVAEDASFSNLVCDNDTVGLSSAAVTGLDPWRTYYWRVQACGATGCSRWSEFWSFRTAVGAPMIAQPGVDEQLPYDYVRFSWNTVDGAQRYELQISEFQSFGVVEFEEMNVVDTLYNPGVLPMNMDYYVRVRAVSEDGPGPWSLSRHFATSSVAGVDDGAALPVAQLLTPAPHPFASTAEIAFTLPPESSVRLELYDLTGRRVAVIAEGRYPAGHSSAAFNAAGLPAGMYLLRLTTPEGSIQRPVLHLR